MRFRTKTKPTNCLLRALLSVAAVLLCVAIASCGGGSQTAPSEGSPVKAEVYTAVPSDVVAIFDMGELGDLSAMVSDTSYFGYGLLDPKSPLLKLYSIASRVPGAKRAHTLYTVQYSGRNEISLLQIIDFGSDAQSLQTVVSKLDSLPHTQTTYNGAICCTYSNGLSAAVRDNFLIASSSVICVESSLRHLANGSSILNNAEFAKILSSLDGSGYFFLNHKQIGKIFSSSVTRPFLTYAEFFQQYATWSALRINARQKNFVSLEGESINNSDIINYSTVYLSSSPEQSSADEFLPASTVYALVLRTQGAQSSIKSYKRFLDAHKKLNNYEYNAERVSVPGEKKPAEWFASENFTEVVSAFCLVGGKYEWLTFTCKSSSGFFRRLTGMKKRTPPPVVEKYKYPGYIAAVLGEAFSHTKEESICKIGDWSVIGSSRAISEFEQGRANAVTLKRYLSRTPASSLFSNNYSARVWINISDGADTVLSALNKYYRGRVESSLKVKNFEAASVGVRPSGGKTMTTLNYYASKLSSPPQMFPEGSDEEQFFVDSTIKVEFNPYTLVDPLSGDTLYFEQSKKYLSIFLSNSKKKTLWGIPMKDTLRSCAGFVTIGSKSYIAFAMGSKLYMISPKGAFAYGYPKDIGRKIALGPKVVKEKGEYRLLILDSLNIISKTNLDGERAQGWKDIHAPEFTHHLPDVQVLFGKEYYILRTVFRTRIYTSGGEEIAIKDKKRSIAKDSPIVEDEPGFVRVMGLDGNEFLLNLSTGKTKKL